MSHLRLVTSSNVEWFPLTIPGRRVMRTLTAKKLNLHGEENTLPFADMKFQRIPEMEVLYSDFTAGFSSSCERDEREGMFAGELYDGNAFTIPEAFAQVAYLTHFQDSLEEDQDSVLETGLGVNVFHIHNHQECNRFLFLQANKLEPHDPWFFSLQYSGCWFFPPFFRLFIKKGTQVRP